MSRPEKAEALRLGTRLLWAQKLKAKRLRLGISFYRLRVFMSEASGRPNLRLTTFGRYERLGPPTLKKARYYSSVLDLAAEHQFGGEQLDIVDAIRRTPRRP